MCTNHSHFSLSMSVTQAMEWLIEHVDDPTVDTPLPGQEAQGAAASAAAAPAPVPVSPSPMGPSLQAAAAASSQASLDEAKQDELTEIFKRIRRKREFRPDSRVSAVFHKQLFSENLAFSFLEIAFMLWLYTDF